MHHVQPLPLGGWISLDRFSYGLATSGFTARIAAL